MQRKDAGVDGGPGEMICGNACEALVHTFLRFDRQPYLLASHDGSILAIGQAEIQDFSVPMGQGLKIAPDGNQRTGDRMEGGLAGNAAIFFNPFECAA
jgi:hypothetical protein